MPGHAAYEVDGNHVVPLPDADGPWFEGQQHGGALLGLFTRFVEQVPSFQPMRTVRLSADLSRPVPMEPCTMEAHARRDGKRVQSIEATLSHRSEVLARATATRIRIAPGLVPAEKVHPRFEEDEPPPWSDDVVDFPTDRPTFHNCLDTRQVDDLDDLRHRAWYRLTIPLVAGEEVTPTVRVGCIADMIRSAVARLGDGWVSINPEVTYSLEREPVGDWIAIDSTVRFTTDGTGTAEGVLFDQDGRIGLSSKSIINFER